MSKNQKEAVLDALLERGIIAEVLPNIELLRKKILSDNSFHIYFGIDPTNQAIHLGIAQQLLVLKNFRKMGAKVTILLGKSTAKIGDPTDKDKERPVLEEAEVANNITRLKKQIRKIMNIGLFDREVQIIENDWYEKISTMEFLKICSNFTVQHLLERDMFEKRMKKGGAVHLHEFLYPILQGYDSYVLDTDAELSGTDQTFNALIGRTLQKRLNNKEKIIITTKLIADEQTGEKMSKSTGTGIFFDLSSNGAENMFGSVMSLPDTMIFPVFLGATETPLAKIGEYQKKIQGGANPLDVKMKLAEEVLSLIYDTRRVQIAKESFITQFQKKETPEQSKKIAVKGDTPIIDFLVSNNICKSRRDAKGKIFAGAVSLDGEKVLSIDCILKQGQHSSIRVGREAFIIV